MSPAVEALLVTPAAPHSAYNRGIVVSASDTVTLRILAASGRLAVEVDGMVAGYAGPGERLALRGRPAAARVIRLGRTTFYERARRKLRLTDSAEIPSGRVDPGRVDLGRADSGALDGASGSDDGQAARS